MVDSLPQTPMTHLHSSLCSTPNTALSPTLTPFSTPSSSPHSAALAAVLAQANSSLQLSPQCGTSLTHPSPSPITIPNGPSPCTTPTANPHVGLSSPQATTANTMYGKSVVPIAAKQTMHSPVSIAKAVLHHRCPGNQPESVSPLVKSSYAESTCNVQSSPMHGSPSSSMTAKSPSAKFVTVSKVSDNERLNSILQQLQNPNISKLLSTANVHSSENGASS